MRDVEESNKETVYSYFEQTFERAPSHDAGTSGLKEYPLASHCGQECKKIIDSAAALMKMCDDHRHVVEPLLSAITAAIEIVCFG